MALQISFTDKRGVANTEAYVIINEIKLLLLFIYSIRTINDIIEGKVRTIIIQQL